jgi:uncharacterized protein YdaU (DUF1376 family)
MGEAMPRRREEWQGRNKGSAYIRWYSGDVLSDGFVAGLTPLEENCYRRLLDFNARDGFIPDDPARLALMCKLSAVEFDPIWLVLSEKFPLNNHTGKRSNTRIKFELLYQKKRSISAQERGKKGGRPAKQQGTKTISGNPEESYSLAERNIEKPIQIQDPDPDPDPDIREEEEEEAPPMNIKWNGKEFGGPDFQLLVKTIKTRYEPEMGANWVRAVWLDIRDWCQDNPEKIAAKKKHDRFVLGWYRREAKQERHGENEATVQTQSEEAHFESQRGDDRELAIAACAKDGGHKLTHRRTHVFCPCGYVEFKEVT